MPEGSVGNALSEGSPSVQTHLGILQGVIERMASNSASAKGWCIAIVSAIIVVVANKAKPDYAFLALIPSVLFLLLDAYYLALEKGFRNAYNEFIQKLHGGALTSRDLYSVSPVGKMWLLQLEALASFSIWAFYLMLGILVVVARWILLQ